MTPKDERADRDPVREATGEDAAARRVRDAFSPDATGEPERLARVRADAVERARRAAPAPAPRRRRLVIGGVGAVAVIVIAAAGFVLADLRLSTSRMVIARAMATLGETAAPGKVTYQKVELVSREFIVDPKTGERSSETTPMRKVMETWRTYAGDSVRVRSVSEEGESEARLDGREGVRIDSDPRGKVLNAERVYGRESRIVTRGDFHYRFVGPCSVCHSAKASASSQKSLREKFSIAPRDDVSLYRRLLAEGVVELAEKRVFGGRECYVLRWKGQERGPLKDDYRVYVDTDRYELLGSVYEVYSIGEPSTVRETTTRIVETRLLDPSELPDGFFDPRGLATDAALDYTVSVPAEDAEALRAYQDVPLYWMGLKAPIAGREDEPGIAGGGYGGPEPPAFIVARGEWAAANLSPVFLSLPATHAAGMPYGYEVWNDDAGALMPIVSMMVRSYPPFEDLEEALRSWGVPSPSVQGRRTLRIDGREAHVFTLARTPVMDDPSVSGSYEGYSALVVAFPDAVVQVDAAWPMSDAEAARILRTLRRANGPK